MFRKVLIANRGEIACRIVRTARAMEIATVAVYSDVDRDALHVRLADEAHRIGPAPAAQSYLNFEAIVSVARETGAEAVHPGYGFLAENADFAQVCADAGLVFVGPSPEAIRAMGDKAAAKAIMEKAGVPVVPGYHGAKQDAATLRRAAERIGFPVLIKASAGGGGKGMRIVRDAKGFVDALAGARREAKASFGDERMLVEKYIERPRHVEVQVFGDGHGNIVHLFERDCSVQRRHQKIVEEAPAPGVDAAWRQRICAAAVTAARAVDYTGAGTVEFIVETGRGGAPGEFWFMEMNTRLQVEHPVTELITGTDLVEWQFRVAAGETLPCAQDALAIRGHAIEARLYAEDPARGFLPAPGRLAWIELPERLADVRVDSGIAGPGATVPPDYDPMIAKLSARGDSRAGALEALRAGLTRTRIAGPATNVAFLARVLDHPEFRAGGVDTGFVERHLESLAPPPAAAPPHVLGLACLALLAQHRRAAARAAGRSADRWSPWARADGWRLNDTGHTVLRFLDGDAGIDVGCRFRRDGGVRLETPGATLTARLDDGPDPDKGPEDLLLSEDMQAMIDDRRCAASVVRDGASLHVFAEGGAWRLGIHDPLALAEAHGEAAGGLTAPMPGKVAAVHVKAGDAVTRGRPLIVVEAMKMEHTLSAPADGTVAEIRFKTGDQVREGEVLVVVDEAGGASAGRR